jgi:hypothetical protein
MNAMKRKAELETDLVAPHVRIKEGLRRRLEAEAKKKRVPLSRELGRRLEESLQVDAMKTIQDVAADLTKLLARARKQLAA